MHGKHLLAYRFGPDSAFQGQLVGALERIESGGALRIVDALFVGRDVMGGELVAVSLTSHGSSGMISRLIGFRLDAAEREKSTQRALEGEHGQAIQALASTISPGNAVAIVLVEHAWAQTLDEAVRRMGGTEITSESIDAGAISEVLPRLNSLVAETP